MHSHREILPLGVARADVLWIGLANAAGCPCADDHGRAVAPLTFGCLAEQLFKHAVIDIIAERIFDSLQISFVPVAGELHPVRKPAGKIADELARALAVTPADEVRDDQLRIGFDTGPGPCVASAFGGGLGALDVALLGVGEAPNLIDLNTPSLHAADLLIVEAGAEFAGINQQLRDRVDARVSQSRDRPHGRSLAQQVEDLGALGVRKLVHAPDDMNFHALRQE